MTARRQPRRCRTCANEHRCLRSVRLASLMLIPRAMSGFITERDFREAEAAFPGIVRLYETLPRKPRTFLDLMRVYLHRSDSTLGN